MKNLRESGNERRKTTTKISGEINIEKYAEWNET